VYRVFSDFEKARLEPDLQATLHTDDRLTKDAKAIEQKKMEKKRQVAIQQANQVTPLFREPCEQRGKQMGCRGFVFIDSGRPSERDVL
jgi:hypothetical protein